MDFYLKNENVVNRLLDEYIKFGSLVIAFDFDDTVYDFHNKGRTYKNIIEILKKLKNINCYLICWTGNEDLAFVEKYLKENEIPFDTINENPSFYKSASKKIYANAYLDDRAGLLQTYNDLKKVLAILSNHI